MMASKIYILESLEVLSREVSSDSAAEIFKLKSDLNEDVIGESVVLQQLSKCLRRFKDTKSIARCFYKVLLQLVSASIPLKCLLGIEGLSDREKEAKKYEHIENCIILSLLLDHPDVYQFTLKYFDLNGVSPFEIELNPNPLHVITPKKRHLKRDTNIITNLAIVKCSYNLLVKDPVLFKNKWNWSIFIQRFHQNKNKNIKWFFKECLVILTGIDYKQSLTLAKTLGVTANITQEIKKKIEKERNSKHLLGNHCQANELPSEEIQSTSLQFGNVMNIDGILLPIHDEDNLKEGSLIQVKSTVDNLKSVALSVASGKSVCLTGPVGCGKTALVEYLAGVTGRQPSAFHKVQLGDQTDSRMLLGAYQCTDIPGEFIWRPGVLTQAVQNGWWLLLEDIDCAALDVASVLSSLLERNVLSVPGYKDALPVAPGFQLFLTQRTTDSGFQKRSSNTSALLQRHWMQINIEPLSRHELIEIIQIKYPELKTIAARMVEVFMIFSVGSHDTSLQSLVSSNESEMTISNLPTMRGNRLISTRDLIKWCQRMVGNFKVSSPEYALKALQDAIDIFVCYIADPELRLVFAKKISTTLSIVETKAEFYSKSYKPNVRLNPSFFEVGRARLVRKEKSIVSVDLEQKQVVFSFTRPSSCLLERIACCVAAREPVLLVGETGTGKTSSVQYLARQTGHKLVVINMNQQSDSTDLLGGYKPVDLKYIINPIRREFEELFCKCFDVDKNQKFLSHIANCYESKDWNSLYILMTQSTNAARKKILQISDQKNATNMFKQWQALSKKLSKLQLQIKAAAKITFAFIEGTLVKAMLDGHWVLLDEINLASAEILECLSGLLDESVELYEKSEGTKIDKHKDFTLFACMNPATDIGKKELPVGLRNRFTEFFVDELSERNDLVLLVGDYLYHMNLPNTVLDAIYSFYKNVKKEAAVNLVDGAGQMPHYSLRTLCRALMAAAQAKCGTLNRSLYEAFCLSFLTQLDSSSHPIVEAMIAKAVLGKKDFQKLLKQPIPEPQDKNQNYLLFEGHWIPQGFSKVIIQDDYVMTQTVRKNLRDIARVISLGKLPVLVQGDTSVGKTSLITYIARASGNYCVRINNHEHTDLQEYVGSYTTDLDGKLIFKEGVLVEAMRKGYWIILDELNLAPSDVLEALNRVLDDNRELYIPETQQTIKAHSNFMLFATQNPPGLYGGRKMLSRAFRNRFVELHFDEIPRPELETIVHQRCHMPLTYCRKIISVMAELQVRRRGSAAVLGKDSFITLRDLFRWGQRYKLASSSTQKTGTFYDWDQHLADEGYLVLAGKVRQLDERCIIQEVLIKHLKREVDPEKLFSLSEQTSSVTKYILESLLHNSLDEFPNIVWTFNMRRLAVLIAKSFEFVEPVLLVGETGCGKTTICQVFAALKRTKLLSVNCHLHTESSDFLGGLRPVRTRSNDGKLFEWVDGPLIQAVEEGCFFLADEISLADDSVLERLNSLLETERQLVLTEKGTNPDDEIFTISAKDGFFFIGTMNPGGDYGKKELSPALRNRFTEIWCDHISSRYDLMQVIEKNFNKGLSFGNQEDGSSGIGNCMLEFVEWLKLSEITTKLPCNIRDLLSWVNFINSTVGKKDLDVCEAYVHGACLTFLDSLGTALTCNADMKEIEKFKSEALDFLFNQIKRFEPEKLDYVRNGIYSHTLQTEYLDNGFFGIRPFYIPTGSLISRTKSIHFNFSAPTTSLNSLRLLRGLQLDKAILLEGDPGVGKTSLVIALAKAAGHNVVRINLSDQTDVTDLFGTDLPSDDGSFTFKEGAFLTAWKNGDWILLDELNLAPQPVLEGLNACLDHRGEVFVPELGRTFKLKNGTRLFACQNPLKQGGARRGLPLSFLNRFTQVFVDTLTREDLVFILESQFPHIKKEIRENMVSFNNQVYSEINKEQQWGQRGGPWDMNLRDIQRWCEAITHNSVGVQLKRQHPGCFVDTFYTQRMRCSEDRQRMINLYESSFDNECYPRRGDTPLFYKTSKKVYFGDISLPIVKQKNVDYKENKLMILRSQLSILKSIALCVKKNWLCILVGPAASGKSCVLQTLATLMGCELKTLPVTSAMDVTDLLGGYEQVDYTRNLDLIYSKIESNMYKILRNLLLSPHIDFSEVKSIFNKMHIHFHMQSYSSGKDDSGSLVENTTAFKKKAIHLFDLCEYLLKLNATEIDISNDLSSLKTDLSKLIAKVKKTDSIQVGGKFEWIDSLLVKCLLNGSWIVLDNVNLASAAVLDRLNALLEPNGVLSIPERGDRAEIRPHSNFRIFFTMDPKHGEISRAMRNRGVELYMIESENQIALMEFPTLDLSALLLSYGLPAKYHKVCKAAHEAMFDFIQGLDRPSLSHLEHAAYLICQQLSRGVGIKKGFLCSFIDVYIKPRCIGDFMIIRGNLSEMKNLMLKSLEEVVNTFPYDTELDSVQHTLSVAGLIKNPSIEISKQIAYLPICQFTNEHSKNVWMLVFSLFTAYQISSKVNSSILHKYLKENFYAIMGKSQDIDQGNAVFTELNKTAVSVSIPAHHNSKMPMDIRFYSEITDRNSTKTAKRHVISLLHALNRKATALTLKSENFSPFKYSEAIAIGKITDDFVEYPILRLCTKIINAFDNFIDTHLNYTISFIELINLLNWRNRFVKKTIEPMFIMMQNNKMPLLKEELVASLNIHLHWWKQDLLKSLKKCFSDDEVKAYFSSELLVFETIVSDVKSPIKYLGNQMKKNIGQPSSIKDSEHFEAFNRINNVVSEISAQKIIKMKNFKNLVAKNTKDDLQTLITDVGIKCDPYTMKALDSYMNSELKQRKKYDNLILPFKEYLLGRVMNLLQGKMAKLTSPPSQNLLEELLPSSVMVVDLNNDVLSHLKYSLLSFNSFSIQLCSSVVYLDSIAQSSFKPVENYAEIFLSYWNEYYRSLNSSATINSETSNLSFYSLSQNDLDEHTNGASNNDQQLLNISPLLINNVFQVSIQRPINKSWKVLAQDFISLNDSASYLSFNNDLSKLIWQNMSTFSLGVTAKPVSDALFVMNIFKQMLLNIVSDNCKNEAIQNQEASFNHLSGLCNKYIVQIFNEEKNELVLEQMKKLLDLISSATELANKILQSLKSFDQNLDSSTKEFELNINTSKLLVLSSICITKLMAEVSSVDPVQENKLELAYLNDDTEVYSSLLQCYYSMGVLLGSVPYTDSEDKFSHLSFDENDIQNSISKLHPYSKLLLKAKERANSKKKLINSNVYRPEKPAYFGYYKDCSHFSNSLLSFEVVHQLYQELSGLASVLLNQLVLNTSKENHESFIRESKMKLKKFSTWKYSMESFYRKISKEYLTAFPDLVKPLLYALSQTCYAFSSFAGLCEQLLTKVECSKVDLDYTKQITLQLLRFPRNLTNNDFLNDINSILNNKVAVFIAHNIDENEDSIKITDIEYHRLLISNLQEVRTHCIWLNTVDNKSFQSLNTYFDKFLTTWNQQQEEYERKKEEEDNLYVTKSKCEDVDEDEEDLEEMMTYFPNHTNDDFFDFQPPSLEQNEAVLKASKAQPKALNNQMLLSHEDYTLIYTFHSELMKNFTQAEWLQKPNVRLSNCDHISPFLQKYMTFSKIVDSVIKSLESNIEAEVTPGLMVLLNYVKANIHGDSIDGGASKPDFYRSSWVAEVRQCLPLLELLKEKILQLLEQWPDFPTLKDILEIVNRVMDFSISSPVSRYLIGLELLGDKVEEWNKNAHKGNNLIDISLQIGQQIIRWRKLEMLHWKECLNIVLKKKQAEAHKYWFFIYGIVTDYLNEEDVTEIDPSKKTTDQQLVQIFKQFVEKSTVGDFEVRLDILYTFHCHIVHYKPSAKRDVLLSILWNLYKYYSQFVPQVHNYIKEKRTPIEKKLKEFVKICTWDRDLSYWSVKITVFKSHKTLHKHMKQFQNVLSSGVMSRLCLDNQLEPGAEHVGLWDRPKRNTGSPAFGSAYMVDPQSYLALTRNVKKYLDLSMAPLNNEKIALLYKVGNLFNKSKKLCKDTILQTFYPSLVQNLDDFVTQVIDTSSHLGGLEVSQDLPKPKQVSQAKSIIQMKRKGLADLFRSLLRMGLSYRSGIRILNTNGGTLDEFVMPPTDLDVALSYIKTRRSDTVLTSLWAGCDTYFQRNIARQHQLLTALQAPSSELGIQNVERCKGYAAILLNCTQIQKKNIGQYSRQLCKLRALLTTITTLSDSPIATYNQSVLRQKLLVLQKLYATVGISLEQFAIMWKSLPEMSTATEEFEDTYDMVLSDSPIVKCHKNSAEWIDIKHKIDNFLGIASKQSSALQKSNTFLPNVYNNAESKILEVFTNHHLETFNEALNQAQLIRNQLDDILNHYQVILKNTGQTNITHPALRSLQDIIKIIDSNFNQLNNVHELVDIEMESVHFSIENFALKVEELIATTLLSIQNIYKTHCTSNANDVEGNTQETEEPIDSEVPAAELQPNDDNIETSEPENELLWDGHIKTHLQEDLSLDIKSLNIDKIIAKLNKILMQYLKFIEKGGSSADEAKQILAVPVPLIEQYSLLTQYFITQQVAAHRVTCKLLSVLLKIFTDLAIKGFCRPSGLDMEEGEGEGGPGKLTGGTGLGDGEGQTDVSDRIENQDQLDDARKPDEEKEKEEDKDCKEEEKGVNMTDDFESHLQDVDKEDDESNKDEEEDPDKQMGETGDDAERLDQQIWGSEDDEPESEDENTNKNEKEEKGKGESLDKQMAAKEDSDQKDVNEEEKGKEKKQKEKDINDMKEPEVDDDHVDPYHSKEQPIPEPEPFDLPENLNMDGENQDEDKEGETENENPFDIDVMKDQQEADEAKDDDNSEAIDQKDNTKNKSDEISSDEEDESDPKPAEDEDKMDVEEDKMDVDEDDLGDQTGEIGEDEPETEENDAKEQEPPPQFPGASDDQEKPNDKEKPEDEKDKEEPQDNAMASMDKATAEENIEAAETDKGTEDNVQINADIEKDSEAAPYEQTQEQDGEEKQAIGQADTSQSREGHRGQRDKAQRINAKHQQAPQEKPPPEKRNKPGETEEDRTLGENMEPVQKKMRTVNLEREERQQKEQAEQDLDAEQNAEADLHQHVKQAQKNDVQTLDAATKEQAEEQPVPNKDEEETVPEVESDEQVKMDDEEDMEEPIEANKIDSEMVEGKEKEAKKNKDGLGEDQPTTETGVEMEVEGEDVVTSSVVRPAETTQHTKYGEVSISAQLEKSFTNQEVMSLRQWLSGGERRGGNEGATVWRDLWHKTSGQSRHLCERLRLVLEPTGRSRLAGDFRTGRRLNMRRVIPYVASQFRKDRIWLRRTRPARRHYRIALALDDSSSMANNRSKELAFESLALVSQALNLLESGDLAVLSFGEKPQVLHPFTEQFSEQSGAKLLNNLLFDQNKTKIAQLLDFSTVLFEEQGRMSDAPNAKLLVIVSDGRGIFSEGELKVCQAVRRARQQGIFLVYVIIDNPNNKDSIMDIRRAMFDPLTNKPTFIPYLDSFPFPFYLILRDMTALPAVLGDSLRQWFELAANDLH